MFFNLRKSKKRLGWFSHEQVQDVAEALGVKPETVLEMESRLSGRDIGFDGYQDDDDDSRAFAPAAYLEDFSQEPARVVENADWSSHNKERLTSALATLDERSQDILASRWLAEEKATLHQLAAKYDISAERIRQLEKAAMQKLRSTLMD